MQQNGVGIVISLAIAITRLFDESGASQIERYSALDVAKALIVVSEASVGTHPDADSAVDPTGGT